MLAAAFSQSRRPRPKQARGNLGKLRRAGDRSLQLWVVNEEFLVGAVHQTAPNASLPFVHTARRSYRLNGPVKSLELGLYLSSGRILSLLLWRS
jgi:hypothetical protein